MNFLFYFLFIKNSTNNYYDITNTIKEYDKKMFNSHETNQRDEREFLELLFLAYEQLYTTPINEIVENEYNPLLAKHNTYEREIVTEPFLLPVEFYLDLYFKGSSQKLRLYERKPSEDKEKINHQKLEPDIKKNISFNSNEQTLSQKNSFFDFIESNFSNPKVENLHEIKSENLVKREFFIKENGLNVHAKEFIPKKNSQSYSNNSSSNEINNINKHDQNGSLLKEINPLKTKKTSFVDSCVITD